MSRIPELSAGRALEHGIGMMVDHGRGAGAKMYVGGQAATKTAASAALTNTTTETALDSLAIPANTLVAGSTIRVRSMGITTAQNSTDTLKIYLSLGPTTTALASREELLATTAVDQEDNDVFYIDALIQVRTIGSSGTAVAMIEFQDPDAAATATKRSLKASFTLNTTVEQTLAVSGEWSVANAGNSCRSDVFVVDIVNPST
tara:strand:+ start:10269 stop:10877 length:609 start_codon:yes stop_codon:yes gene_type:complete